MYYEFSATIEFATFEKKFLYNVVFPNMIINFIDIRTIGNRKRIRILNDLINNAQ